jgi:hypothetical protein
METFLRAIEAYSRFDPAGWVSLYRFFPSWAGAVLAVLGALMMLFGGGRLFRLVASPLGAAVGLLWTPVVAAKLGMSSQAPQIRIFATLGLSGLGLLYPPGVTFFAVGVPLGLVAGEMAGNDWVMGFVPGFIIGGALAVAAHHYIGAVTSSFVGAWLLLVGLLAALHDLTPRGVESVAQQPWGVLIAAGFFGVAGSLYQLLVRRSPEERAARKQDRALRKRKAADVKAVENRWSNYSKDKGLD